jgi:peptidoglycan hydrolase-like protein with peptidoglycan-binding domain
MRVLHQSGQPVPEVLLLQRLLNRKLSSGPKLKEDLVFGPRTAAEVKKFQHQQRLAADGRVGADTWSALGLKTDIHHPVRLFAQPTYVLVRRGHDADGQHVGRSRARRRGTDRRPYGHADQRAAVRCAFTARSGSSARCPRCTR